LFSSNYSLLLLSSFNWDDSFFVQFDLSHDNDFLSIIDGRQIKLESARLFLRYLTL